MDEIQQIIHSLTKNEQKEFRTFIQRNRFRNARIDLTLFNLFTADLDYGKDEILMLLYEGEVDRNTYHSVRKRLVKHLNDFIYLKRIDTEEDLEAEVAKSLVLVRHLFTNNLVKLAWKNLKKAEKFAINAELNQQLQNIYEIQISHYNKAYVDEPLKQLVKKRKKSAELAQEDQNLKIIGSFVKQELEKVKIEAEDIDLERILDLLLNTFEMGDSLFRRPKLRYNFVLIARGIILANKQFYSFEDYVISNYDKINDSGYFDKRPSNRLTMLYIISHTLYRNKKFEKAIDYLNKMEAFLSVVQKGIFNRFNVKYHLLRAACENFMGRNLEAIQRLEEALNYKIQLKEDAFNVQLNLSIYYFQMEEFKKANQQLIRMEHTDNWYEKNMGVEWRIKKNLIEVIYQFELDRKEIALDRILAMEKRHRLIFDKSKYARVRTFLGLIKTIIKDEFVVQSDSFKNQVEGAFEWVEKEKEDLQAMSYYAWLKSKMLNRKFYDVLRELMFQDLEE